MKRKESTYRPMVGGSALIVIFAVLSLVTFALLMLSTESSSERLSKVSAEAVSDFYEADCLAEETLFQIKSGNIPPHVTRDGNSYTYTEQISDTRLLHVEVEYRDGEWDVLRWQALSTVR
ncbi:MAG: hypothetical protein IJO81_02565 [Clostridia bacterium]|nr:hypothetical protein [Clostridia bacterium]